MGSGEEGGAGTCRTRGADGGNSPAPMGFLAFGFVSFTLFGSVCLSTGVVNALNTCISYVKGATDNITYASLRVPIAVIYLV